jgi:hypothetical protein
VSSCVIPSQICCGVLGIHFFSLNMGNLRNRGRNSLRKEIPIEKVDEEGEKARLHMSNLRMLENKEITMVNLSNVTHTCVCGTSNEQVASIVASVVETNTNASIGIEGLL